MNPYLSELFGQGGYSEEDLEKMAAYDLLTKIAADEGWDPDQLTDEEVEYLLAELTNAEAGAEGDLTEEEKLAEAQEGEAYHLGGVMAHGYWDELEKLGGGEPTRMARAGKYLFKPTSEGGRYSRLRGAATSGFRSKAKGGAETKMERLKAMGAMAAHASPEVGAAGALGAGGVAGYKALKKEAEDFEALAEERAEEMLAEAVDDDGYEIDADDVADYVAEQYGIDPTELDEESFVGAAEELDSLVKEAEAMEKQAKAWKAVKGGAGKAWEATKKYHKGGASQIRSAFAKTPRKGGQFASKKLHHRIGRGAAGAARFLPHAAAAGGAGYGGYRALKKEAEIEELDEAINDRAVEMLYEAGYIE
jgi:hypothetical protein